MISKHQKLDFDQHLVKEYFKYGSINKAFQKHKYNLPISFAGYDRVLDKYKVVKSAGPNSKLSESLYILSILSNYKIPLERIYHQFAPKTIQVSTNTLHRILHYIRMGLTRRQGVILIITAKNKPDCVLIGNDNSLVSNSELGKKGDITLPMGYSKVGESAQNSIVRILQNEVFTDSVVFKTFPWKIIPDHVKPIMQINITDICASVYKLQLPEKYPEFSSYKLSNLKLVNINKIDLSKSRPGVKDVLNEYQEQLSNEKHYNPSILNSELNSKIYALAKEPIK